MALFDKKDLEEMLSDIKTELAKKSGKKKIVYVDASSSTTVVAGSSETITVQPPEGKIWRIKDAFLRALSPSSSARGINYFSVGHLSTYWKVLHVQSTYNHEIRVRCTVPTEYDEIVPNSESLFSEILRNIKSSYNYPLIIKYFNSTDTDQTEIREIVLWLEEEDEAT